MRRPSGSPRRCRARTRLDAEHLGSAPHRLGIVAAVEQLLRNRAIGHLLRTHQIAESHLVRLAADRERERVHQASHARSRRPGRATPRYGCTGGLLLATVTARARTACTS